MQPPIGLRRAAGANEDVRAVVRQQVVPRVRREGPALVDEAPVCAEVEDLAWWMLVAVCGGCEGRGRTGYPRAGKCSACDGNHDAISIGDVADGERVAERAVQRIEEGQAGGLGDGGLRCRDSYEERAEG